MPLKVFHLHETDDGQSAITVRVLAGTVSPTFGTGTNEVIGPMDCKGVTFEVPSELNAEEELHNSPCRQFVVWLSGGAEIGTSDGVTHRFEAGDVLLADDTGGVGHSFRFTGPGKPLILVLPLESLPAFESP